MMGDAVDDTGRRGALDDELPIEHLVVRLGEASESVGDLPQDF
jgi:hypothetical protein